ncbi:hypothetical protein A7P98_05900 [Eikenella sp. NML080894]|nr:hypothetical protein A7P94_09440 [Eikenella sp. NML01-A-086]OAM36089.1 hypothetical protein A7P98_05900 [Eikenella sp. NML080894]OAM38069.1 hypothetical protein A7P99_06800 [Eikenella sp. NML120348]
MELLGHANGQILWQIAEVVVYGQNTDNYIILILDLLLYHLIQEPLGLKAGMRNQWLIDRFCIH